MGFPYHELVPPAILLDNPGIDRRTFTTLLNRIKANWMIEYERKDPWNSGARSVNEFHSGLEGLARVLRLEETEKYKQFRTPTYDANHIAIHPPQLIPIKEESGLFPDFKFEVRTHKENLLGNPERTEECSWVRLEEGDLWEDLYGFHGAIVTKIYSEKLPENKPSKKREDEENPENRIYHYDMEVRHINQKWENFVFSSEKEVYSKFPLFSPKKRFEWNQQRGKFYCLMSNDFRWLMEDGKYYLDPETFNRIGEGFSRTFEGGYHDLILTAEAIKQKAWKVLSYKGLKHLPQFLQDFPESRARYEKAVWDSQTSLYAKQKEMTVSDFLRWRQGAR